MRIVSRLVSAVLSLSLALVITGCGGSPAPTVAISPSATSVIDQGQTVTLTAAVTNDTNSAGVSWTVSGGGTLSSSTTTGTTYTAPATVSTTTTATVTAASIATPALTATHAITVNPAPAITTTTLAAGTVGTAYSVTLAATGGSGTLNWTVNSGTLPTGITLSSAGVLSGTVTSSTGPSTTTLTFKVTDSAATPLSATSGSLTLAINPVTLAISAPALANGILGTLYTSGAYTATGGTGAINWSATGLPAGLALSASTGASVTLTGTPTTAATYSSIVVTATDSGASTFLQTKSTTAASVIVYPTLTEGTLSAVSAVQNVTALNIAAPSVSGGTGAYTWSATGLPAGVAINSGTGAVTGTPTTATGSPFTASITVKDAGTPQQSKSTNLVITVIPTLAVSTPSLANAIQNIAYTSTLATSGGSGAVTWSIVSGAPLGFVINPSTGALTGTAATTAGSPFSVKVQAVDSGSGPLQQTAQATLSLTVIPTLAITTASVPTGTVGTAYSSTTFAATGGFGTLTWSATGVPAGMSLSAAGILSGTPTAVNAANINVTVTDSGAPQQSKSVSLLLTVNPGTPVVTTTSLAVASLNLAYNQTLAVNANGNVGAATWAVTSGGPALTSAGFTLNPATGAITGTPTSTAGSPVNFSVTATVASVTSAAQALSITIVAAPTITTSTLPPAYVGQSYSTTLAAVGGTGGYKNWTVTSGSATMTLLGLSLNANTGVISGTPAATGSGSITVTVQDSANTTSTAATFTVSGYNVLALPAANPGSLPAGSVSGVYTGSISATGGVGPNYTWTVNSTQLTNNTPFALSGGGVSGLNVTTTGNGVLNVTGTPIGTGTLSFTVAVKDGANTIVGPTTYTIVVSTTYSITGAISMPTACGSSLNLSGVTVTLSGSGTGTATTNGSGVYTFSNLAAGSYTITPSLPTATAVFYPATLTSSISTSNLTNSNFFANVGYNVSGTVSYSGGKTGRIYLALNNSCSNNSSQQGTSIAAGGAYTIRGVPPGTYTLTGTMDNVGSGSLNGTNPAGSTSSVTVSTANVTGANVTLNNPTLTDLSTGSGPELKAVGGYNGGAIVLYGPIGNNNIEQATSYTLEYSTSSSFASVLSKTFPATGNNGATVWFVNGLTNGTTYYFRARGTNGTTTSPATVYMAGGSSAAGVTAGAPTGGVAVTGTVSYAGITPASGSVLYTGFVNPNSGAFYITPNTSPAANSSTYSVQVPTGSYLFVSILDQNNNGALDIGDISDTNDLNTPTTINGAGTQNLTLPTASTVAYVNTQHTRSTFGVTTVNTYSLSFTGYGLTKLPVAMALTSGPNVVTATDIAECGSCGRGYQYYVQLNGTAPSVGDSYNLAVTYSDSTTENVTATVTGVLGANTFATSLAPVTGGSVSTQPTFSWTYPTAPPANAVYQFQLFGNSGTLWKIPGDNSDSNGFTASQIPMPGGLVWNADPTGDGSLPGSGTNLSTSTTYNWQVETIDANGNSAVQQVQYQP